MFYRQGEYTIEPWPNGLGFDVFKEGMLLGEVADDPAQAVARVHTVGPDGKPEKFLKLLCRPVDPVQAIEQCLAEGRPIEEEA